MDLDRLAANYRAAAALAQRPLWPVVKADAYGHGATRIALHLQGLGASGFAVAFVEEALALRAAGITGEILVFCGTFPGQEDAAAAHGLLPVVSTPEQLERAVARPGSRVHLKLDVGMARLGFDEGAFLDAARRLARSGVEVDGVMTHLSAADEDRELSERQLDRFDRALERLAVARIRPPRVHAVSSAGLGALRPTHTLARPGLALYGIPTRPLAPPLALQPVLQVTAPVLLVKDVAAGTPVSYGGRWRSTRPARIATLALGYGDGVPRPDARRVSGRVRVRGTLVPTVGTVCMDLTLLDVTGVPGVAAGDEVVLLGDSPTAWDVADWAGTNAWQVVTGLLPRLPRVYVAGGQVQA